MFKLFKNLLISNHQFLITVFMPCAIMLLCTNVFAQGPDTLWTKTYGGTDWDDGCSVQECASGGFIIAGETSPFPVGTDGDVYLIRTDASGDTLWTKTYGGTRSDWGRSVQECAGGGFVIAGGTESFGNGFGNVYLIRTDADGDTLWTKTYGGTYTACGYSIEECDEGGFIIAGRATLGAGSYDVYLIRTDTQGDTLWTKTYGGTGSAWGKSVQECASGGFVIAGIIWSCDVWLIRISETGVEEETGNRHKAIGISLEVYPNPSFGNVLIKYGVPEKASITLGLYDISGRLVKRIYSGTQGKGYHNVWQNELSTGIYFVRFETDKFKATRKLIILK